MPPTTATGFEWVPEELEKLFRRNGFGDITDFINTVGESRSTIYHSIKTGDVSLRVMELFAQHLGADFGNLIRLKSPVRKLGRKPRKTPRRTTGSTNDKP